MGELWLVYENGYEQRISVKGDGKWSSYDHACKLFAAYRESAAGKIKSASFYNGTDFLTVE